MAEGWANYLLPDELEAYSAGTEPKGVDPRAIKAMAEVGIGISVYRSRSVTDLPEIEFDYVVTLCDDVQQTCPVFPAKTKIIHQSFDDPARLAEKAINEEQAMHHYRRVRDEVKAYVQRQCTRQ